MTQPDSEARFRTEPPGPWRKVWPLALALVLAVGGSLLTLLPDRPLLDLLLARLRSATATHAQVMCSRAMLKLARQADSALAAHAGRFAVAVYDLQTGDSMLINGQDTLHAASLIKLPIMMAAMTDVDSGRMGLADSIAVAQRYQCAIDSSSFEVGSIAALPRTASLERVLQAMITVSDNRAANALIHRLTIPHLSAFLKSHGYTGTAVRRYLMDEKAFAAGIENTTTAHDIMAMLRDIVMERGLSRASARGMLKLLLAQTHNDKLPAGLPADARIAHKTGRITGVEHDAGIVALPDGREYIVVFLSSGLSSAGDGIESARATSRLVFEYEAAAARLTDPRLRLPPIDIRD